MIITERALTVPGKNGKNECNGEEEDGWVRETSFML